MTIIWSLWTMLIDIKLSCLMICLELSFLWNLMFLPLLFVSICLITFYHSLFFNHLCHYFRYAFTSSLLLKYPFFFNKFIYLFIYFWLCWVFVSVRRLSPVAASGGYSSSWCTGFTLPWLLLLWSTGSTHAGSVVVAHGLSCSAACGIFPDQGSNPCPLHWQADS